jgi:hypothetical protein
MQKLALSAQEGHCWACWFGSFARYKNSVRQRRFRSSRHHRQFCVIARHWIRSLITQNNTKQDKLIKRRLSMQTKTDIGRSAPYVAQQASEISKVFTFHVSIPTFTSIYIITKILTHGIKTTLIVGHVIKSNYLPKDGECQLTEMVNWKPNENSTKINVCLWQAICR